jgi:calcineurin-like phosphoesterase family protein
VIYVTGDTHFAHKWVIKYSNRPFETYEQMDAAIIDNINNVVEVKDTLIHVGDFAMYKKYEEYRKRIKCKNIILCRGNHDHDISRNRLETIFSRVEDIFVLKHEGKVYVFSHYPFKVWPQRHYGAFNVHGHCHGNLVNPEPNSIDVGVDCTDFSPISLEECNVRINMQNEIISKTQNMARRSQ